MPHKHLGLFDTPPSKGEARLSLAVAGVLFAAAIPIIWFNDVPAAELPTFIPLLHPITLICDLIIATILYAQGAVFRSRGLTILASAFVFMGALIIPYILAFPGALAPDGLLGDGYNSPGWIMFFRWLAFPLAVIAYSLVDQGPINARNNVDQPVQKVGAWATGAIALAAVVASLAIARPDWLPELFINRRGALANAIIVVSVIVVALTAVAMISLLRKRPSLLNIWLLAALWAWMLQAIINAHLSARFSIGWYALQTYMTLAHVIVLVALIGEGNRLYARMALALAARERERDNRLMSMDAVAAAISHEVGQPLAAISLNASAGLRSLTASEPDQERAIKALRETIDAGQRTFEIIKSFRLLFDKRMGSLTEFDLNELVHETATMLSREFAAHKISLQLSLGHGLTPVLANRVQIQRVLVNLLTNAIESVSIGRRRDRRVVVRSSMPDYAHVLVEISDTGGGIAQEEVENIFEPFFTTKSTGTGLGLSLSRTIAEEHGGRLWATPGNAGGATFHLQLPPSGAPQRDGGEALH